MSSSGLTYIPLQQGAGYGVVVGLGLGFSLFMMSLTFVLKRYKKEVVTAENFATSGRNNKKHLISACVVSSWTWGATLLTSTTQTYNNGVCGAFYYAAGATVQIILFSCLAIKAKKNAPGAHTYLEIVKARYGKTAHITFIIWGLIVNILVTAMLLASGSGVLTDLTGMHVVAACLLLPLGVSVYTLFGGLKATFITDYINGSGVIIISMVFGFTVWACGDALGSPKKVYELVTEAAIRKAKEGNAEGSYLTMRSRSGGIFFLVNIISNFNPFIDNAYFAKAFAAAPSAAMPGYIMGGLAWFAIPFFTATTMGLTALALENTPAWPTYPNSLSAYEVNAGLVLPNAAVAILGKGGAVATLILIFITVTSAMSSELMSVSTVVTFDIYRAYINPKATGKQLITVSHIAVAGFAYIMAAFAIGLYYGGVAMGYLYEMMGVLIGGAVLPAALTLLNRQQNVIAATYTPPIATALAIIAWLVCSKAKFGAVNVTTTFEDDAMLTGNLVALLTPFIIVPVLTYGFKPQNFDWKLLRNIKRVDEEEELIEAETSNDKDEENLGEKVLPVTSQITQVASQIAEVNKEKFFKEQDSAFSDKSYKTVVILCMCLTVALLVLWPMPMYGTSYIFSERFFTGWVVVGFIWIFAAAGIVIIGPVIESRKSIFIVFRGIYWDLTGQSYKVRNYQNENPEEMHAVQSQIETQLSAIDRDAIEGRNLDSYLEVSDEKKD